MKRLLVLRPEPGASKTVDQARELGIDALAIPLFEIEAVAWEAPDTSGFDGLLLTSANSVRHAGDQLQQLRGLPVYAVGEATASSARAAGFDIQASGESGVDRLLSSIEEDLKLLHLCGRDRREPQGARQRITSVPVYIATAIHAPDLSAARGTVALVHSPRAGRRFAELADRRGMIAIAAISEAAADAAGSGWQTVQVAERPTDTALLALAARLCNNPAPA